ncbi:MAG: tetratricopeptide repeat protein [Bacteroidota bacterium]
MEPPDLGDATALAALERLIRRADGFALVFARVNSLTRRRDLAADLHERLADTVRVLEVDVPPETTDLQWLLKGVMTEAEPDERKTALFVYGTERVLSSVRERTGFLPVLNYKRENLQRAVPAPVVLWMPEFALRLIARNAPDVWAWRSGVFEFTSPREEVERAWEAIAPGGGTDEYARMRPDERRARIDALIALHEDYAARDDAVEPEQQQILASLSDRLGRLFWGLGDYDTALERLKRALEWRESVLGPDHPDTLTSVNNLAYLLQERGDLNAAEPLYRRALDGRETVLGPDHPSTLTSVNNLAYLLRARGDLDAAGPLLRLALDRSEAALGPDHPDTLRAVNNLAYLLQARGDLDAAEPLYRRALERRESVLGPDHPDTLGSVNNLAYLLYARGDLDAAEPLFRRALEGLEDRLGPDHPDTQLVRNNLNHLLAETAGPTEADID